MTIADGLGSNSLELKIRHMMCSTTSTLKYKMKKKLKIMRVRSDHGGEFKNGPFEIFCE